MTFGSCSNVTKSFPFTVETMPFRQGETIEIRCTLICPADYSGLNILSDIFSMMKMAYFAYGKDGEPFIPNDRYPVEKGTSVYIIPLNLQSIKSGDCI